VNLFVSLVSLILVVGTNYIVRFIDPEQSIW
jgi:ABC-type polysaccharide transport system permease subunit